MSRPKRWDRASVVDGVLVINLSSWKYFHDYIRQEMLEYAHYIWRGQRDASWTLQTSLDRALTFKPKIAHEGLATSHLDRFKLAARGRRGANPANVSTENEWWAIAQHNGMATPLLDWTESPFVALYFAFEREESPPSGKRAVWAIGGFEKKNSEIRAANAGKTPPPVLETVRPMQDDNARLVSQSGLFTRAPYGFTADSWIREQYKGESRRAPLLKLVIPNEGRPECLRTLNKMNINHLSLFPDIYGAGQHCNKALLIAKY